MIESVIKTTLKLHVVLTALMMLEAWVVMVELLLLMLFVTS